MNLMRLYATKGDWFRVFHKPGMGYYERVKEMNPWMGVVGVAALIFSTMG